MNDTVTVSVTETLVTVGSGGAIAVTTNPAVQVATIGVMGPAGPGVPTGGTTGQVLAKNSATNYDTVWESPTGIAQGTYAAANIVVDANGRITSATATMNLIGFVVIAGGSSGLSWTPTGVGFPTTETLTMSGTLNVGWGGTGATSFTSYAVLCGGTTSTGALQAVSGLGTSGYVLTSNGANTLPTWQASTGGVASFNTRTGAVTLQTSDVTGVLGSGLPVANGGTGDTTLTAYAVMCGGTTSTGAVQSVNGLGTSGYVLTSNGASALPTWQAASGGVASYNTRTGSVVSVPGDAPSVGSGAGNLCWGNGAGADLTSGNSNTLIGYEAGGALTTQFEDVYIGYQAGQNATSHYCVYIGYQAGQNATADETIAIGTNAGAADTGGTNIFIGPHSGQSNTSGSSNVFIGKNAGNSNITANQQCFIGYGSGQNTTGASCCFVGYLAGNVNTSGYQNTAIGSGAGWSNDTSTSAQNWTVIGYQAIAANNTGVVALGSLAVATAANEFCLSPYLNFMTMHGYDASSHDRIVGKMLWGYVVNTEASYTGYVRLQAKDYNGYRTGVSVVANGSAPLLQLYGSGSEVAQPVANAETSGYTAGTSTAVTIDGTFTGGTGSSKYTIGDIVAALKAIGAIAP